jgi:hypothetical protein
MPLHLIIMDKVVFARSDFSKNEVCLQDTHVIHGLSGYLPLQFWSYNFNILKDVYTHIMDYAWSQEFDFHQIFSK